MTYPISIFILDVSNSSTNEMGEELAGYLDDVVNWIKLWTSEVEPVIVRHRSGDEIILVGSGYSTAYTIAFFVSRIWRHKKHMPYFGLSFGDIDKELATIDIEKWIHPLVKQARTANDSIKQAQNRPQFIFEMDQFLPDGTSDSFAYNQFRYEFETLMNSLLQLQQQYIKNQTEIQEAVCSLYFILQQQKAVAKVLGRTAPTISSHYKKGNSDEILNSFADIVDILNSLEKKSYSSSGNEPKDTNNKLHSMIRNHLKTEISTFMNL